MRPVADVDQVDAAQVRRAVVVAGFVGREFVGLSSRRAGLMWRKTVRTDHVRHLVFVVQTVDWTQPYSAQNGLTEIAGHEFDGHEIGGQDIISLENKLYYNAVCNSF